MKSPDRSFGLEADIDIVQQFLLGMKRVGYDTTAANQALIRIEIEHNRLNDHLTQITNDAYVHFHLSETMKSQRDGLARACKALIAGVASCQANGTMHHAMQLATASLERIEDAD